MKIIDISWPISKEMTAWNNERIINFTQNKKFSEEGERNANILFNAHSGTHIDAPAHFLEDGKTIEKVNLENFYGKCRVLDLSFVKEEITKQDLVSQEIQKDEIILLKTRNSFKSFEDNFDTKFVYLEKSGAEYLASKEVKAVGIDYLGIERDQPEVPSHQILLSRDIGIIEGLRLKDVEQGEYIFAGFPLRLVGLEAAPTRAVLIKE